MRPTPDPRHGRSCQLGSYCLRDGRSQWEKTGPRSRRVARAMPPTPSSTFEANLELVLLGGPPHDVHLQAGPAAGIRVGTDTTRWPSASSIRSCRWSDRMTALTTVLPRRVVSEPAMRRSSWSEIWVIGASAAGGGSASCAPPARRFSRVSKTRRPPDLGWPSAAVNPWLSPRRRSGTSRAPRTPRAIRSEVCREPCRPW